MKPAYLALPNGWLTVAESALLLGVSKVSVYKALNCGRLDFQIIEGRKCVERQGLEARFWGSSQRVADRPLHGLASPMAELSDAQLALYCDEHLGDDALAAAVEPIDRWIESQQQEPAWPRIAQLLNGFLGPSWPPPPWDGDQAATVAMALAMAQEAAGG